MTQSRPQAIDANKDQWQEQREKCSADDCVSDAAMMLEKVPTISEGQNNNVRIGSISRKNAEYRGAR